jgi:hypothetical protein
MPQCPVSGFPPARAPSGAGDWRDSPTRQNSTGQRRGERRKGLPERGEPRRLIGRRAARFEADHRPPVRAARQRPLGSDDDVGHRVADDEDAGARVVSRFSLAHGRHSRGCLRIFSFFRPICVKRMRKARPDGSFQALFSPPMAKDSPSRHHGGRVAPDHPEVGAGGGVGLLASLFPIAQGSERNPKSRREFFLRQAQRPADDFDLKRRFHLRQPIRRQRLCVGIGKRRGMDICVRHRVERLPPAAPRSFGWTRLSLYRRQPADGSRPSQ